EGRRLRLAGLVRGGGRRRDGARWISPSDRRRAGGDRRCPLRPRRGPLLDRRRGRLPRSDRPGGLGPPGEVNDRDPASTDAESAGALAGREPDVGRAGLPATRSPPSGAPAGQAQSSGSSSMSRRVSLIQRTVQPTVRIAPTTVSSMKVVIPTSVSVIPTAVRIGTTEGPGRWISSPTGGGSGSSGLMRC